MCRACTDSNPRRCPSSVGEARNSRDRANYAVRTAAGLSSPVDIAVTACPEVTIAPVDLVSVANSLRTDMHTNFHYRSGYNLGDSTLKTKEGGGVAFKDSMDAGFVPKVDWKELETQVTEVGAAVEARASEIAGFTAEEAYGRYALRVEVMTAEFAECTENLKAAHAHSLEVRRRPIPEGASVSERTAFAAAIDDAQAAHTVANAAEEEVAARFAAEYNIPNPSGYRMTTASIARLVTQGGDPITVSENKILGEARLQALAEIRAMGGVDIEVNGGSSKRVSALLGEVGAYYPAEWLEASNAIGNLKVKDTKGRAHYASKKTQKIRVPLIESRYRREGEDAPLESDGWTLKVDDAGVPQQRMGMETYVRRAYSTRKANGYWNGASVEGPPPKGWEEAYELNQQDQKIRYFRQPRFRMDSGEVVSELTVDKTRPMAQWQETGGFGTALHEFGHRAEHVRPIIGHLEEAFLERRTTDGSGAREKLVGIYGSNRERARLDSFTDKYMGKEYTDTPAYFGTADDPVRVDIIHREVFSTGMEAVFSGAFGGLAGMDGRTADADMRSFILGVLATA